MRARRTPRIDADESESRRVTHPTPVLGRVGQFFVSGARADPPALSFNDPHRPAGHDDSSNEEHEAVSSVAEHFPGGIALRNSEDNRRAECEQHGGAKVRKFQGHCFFPLAMW